MTPASRAYVQTQNQTASRERLMVLLFEAALRHIRLGCAALEKSKRAEAARSLTRASDIVAEFISTLKPDQAPELYENLMGVYVFVADRLLVASLDADLDAARAAERVLQPVAEAFAEAVRKVEQGAADVAR